MKMLFIETPSRDENKTAPFGALYAAGAVSRCGQEARIVDYSNEKFSFPSLSNIVNEYKPDLIGLSGITPSYRNMKSYALFLKREYPKIPLVAGGVISSISDLLLTKAGVDMVVHCEAEVAVPSIMRYYKGEIAIGEIPGISYLKDGVVTRTKDAEQVASLDDIPLPPYELLDMKKYLQPSREWVDMYFRCDDEERRDMLKRLAKTPYTFHIITSRGCTHRCIFCYRHMRGIRQHSVKYVIEHIRYLKDNYGVGFFKLTDELTTANRSWILDLCDSLKKERLDINFVVLSARADTVDEDMLVALKSAGCVMLNFGFESGSDIVLKEIRKGIGLEENVRAALLVKKLGIKNVPEIMIGFPSETEDTIGETIKFLKLVGNYPFSVNYVLPFPGTPLWQYCIEKGLIADEEEFILNYKEAHFLQVNLTSLPEDVVRQWMTRIMYDVSRPHFIKSRDYLSVAKLELRRRIDKRIWDRMSMAKNRLTNRLRKHD